MRLQRYLARAGVASRRGSENLMTAGRVTLNGVVATELGTKVVVGQDEVRLDGSLVTINEQPVYLALNKPVGYLTTMSDPQGRETVATLVPCEKYPGLFPVGRLDNDSSGLLLFTTDGEFSHRILHPKWKVYKHYYVVVDGRVTDDQVEQLRQGIELDDGLTAPALVDITERRSDTTELLIKIREGRKRQVRRMCSAVGHPVITLTRTQFGPISLGGLRSGEHRLLNETEIAQLMDSVQLEVPSKRFGNPSCES